LKAVWLFACVALLSVPADAAEVQVLVSGIRNDRGVIAVAICDKASFPAGACPYHATAPAKAGEVTVIVTNVPAGTWAAAVFHDESGAGKLEFSLFGAPKQGFGFSRDPAMRFGPPNFFDAAFSLSVSGGQVIAPLHYPPP